MLVLMAKVDATPALPRESAQASLQYIRQTLEAAGRLSSVSGGGMVVVGCLALAAVEINQRLTAAPWDSGAGTVALAVWGGAGLGRHNLSFTDAVDGHLFHAAGYGGAICAAIRGTGIAGSRFRRAAPGLRQLYLLEARWLNVTYHLRPASSTNCSMSDCGWGSFAPWRCRSR